MLSTAVPPGGVELLYELVYRIGISVLLDQFIPELEQPVERQLPLGRGQD
jgi:hypothetical protein